MSSVVAFISFLCVSIMCVMGFISFLCVSNVCHVSCVYHVKAMTNIVSVINRITKRDSNIDYPVISINNRL